MENPGQKEGDRMELEETKARSMLRMRGLQNKGLIMISRDPKTEELVLVAAKNIRKKWLIFNVPETVWRGRGSKEEVLGESKRLLEETILAD